MAEDSDQKKDFTSIFEIQKTQAQEPKTTDPDAPTDPFVVNELAPIETVDEFQSLDQMGMTEEIPQSAEPAAEPDPNPDLIPTEMMTEPSIEKIRNYSEETRETVSEDVKIQYPFHLRISGIFGPYERDKLLLFITENPIGLSSADLDLQIQSGKVFFPRISEFAAIKLVQEMRDSGLGFLIHPSDQETSDSIGKIQEKNSPISYHYTSNSENPAGPLTPEMPILSEQALQAMKNQYQEMDEVSVVRFVQTEILEIENSPVIQEVIERMTEALKQKAKLKGGNALSGLKREITPMRLPSQYQISIRANVIRY